MAGYDIFSQPQGPAISISLFGDAATAGIAAGKNLPTKTTSIIQGVQQGLDAGLDTINKVQNIVLKQDAIDQLPITDQIQRQQAENGATVVELNKLKLQEQSQLQGLHIDDETAKMEASIAKAKQEKLLREKSQAFLEGFQKADSRGKADMLLGGQFVDVLAANKDLNSRVTEVVASDMNNGVDGLTRRRLEAYLKKGVIRDAHAIAAEKYAVPYAQAEQALITEFAGALAKEKGISTSQLLNNVAPMLADTYDLIPGTNNVRVDRNGNIVSKPVDRNGQAASTLGGYSFIYTDPKNPRNKTVVATGMQEALKSKYDNWKVLGDIVSGKDLQYDLSAVDKALVEQPGKQNTSITTQSFTTQTAEPLRERIAKSTLGVSDTTLSKISPILERLETSLVKDVLPAGTDRQIASSLFKTTVIDTLSRRISDSQFEESPALQAQYNQGAVDANNKKARADVSSDYIYNKFVAPFLPNTPKDLYYKTQRLVIAENVRKMMDAFIENANKLARYPATRISEAQRLTTSLAGIARAGR